MTWWWRGGRVGGGKDVCADGVVVVVMVQNTGLLQLLHGGMCGGGKYISPLWWQ